MSIRRAPSATAQACDAATPTRGFFDYLIGRTGLREIILPTQIPWLRVLLVGTVTEEASHTGYQALVSDTDILHELLDEARARCDIVIVDTPPGLGSVVRRTLEASQHVLVPLQCEPLALQTTPQILRAIQAIVADQLRAHTRRDPVDNVRAGESGVHPRSGIRPHASAARHGARHRRATELRRQPMRSPPDSPSSFAIRQTRPHRHTSTLATLLAERFQ